MLPAKRVRFVVLAAVIVGLSVLLALIFVLQRDNTTKELHIGSHLFMLQVANTDKLRAQGLSKRASLPANQGMLFVFQHASSKCFWMQGMNFPLDIIWLSANKKVAHIQSSVSPNTYPHQFCSSQPALYVIELNASTARAKGVHVGQTLHF